MAEQKKSPSKTAAERALVRRKVFGILAIIVGLSMGIGVLVAGGMATRPLQLGAAAAVKASPQQNVAVKTNLKPKLLVIGDSLSTGFGTSAEEAWPNLLRLDPDVGPHWNVVNASTNGSGYLSVGDNESTFATQLAASVSSDDSLILFFGSENDMGKSAAQVQAAAGAVYAQAKESAPNAKLVVVGPPSYSVEPEDSRRAVRDGVGAAASTAGAEFIDPIEEGWIMGNTGALLGDDGDHPSHAGQIYLEAKMETIILDATTQGANK